MLRKLLKDATGATAIEYGVIVAVVLVAVVGAFDALGAQSAAKFGTVKAAFGGADGWSSCDSLGTQLNAEALKGTFNVDDRSEGSEVRDSSAQYRSCDPIN